MSPGHLRRAFVSAVGLSPHAYSDARRAEQLRSQLADGADVSTAIATAGYGSASRVYERTGDLLGMTPAQAKRGAPGEAIRYTLADTSLGRLVVASTDRGVCLVAFGESDAELAEEVARRFPRATIEPAEGEPRAWVEAVVALVDAPAGPPERRRRRAPARRARHGVPAPGVDGPPRDPPGRTVTYSQLAAAIGRPTATRAVAAACGANPTAVVVPCHRVIGADGSLTGYRWGVERKRVLLDREGAARR